MKLVDCHGNALVSTIIPVYNRGAMLREAVQSVLDQTYRPIEIIIVDDGSTDDTPQVAEALAMQYPDVVRVLRQENAGPGMARQAGLEVSRGEFIQYLDSDDLLMPNKFSLQVEGLSNDQEAGISYGLSLARDELSGASATTHGTERKHRNIFPAILRARLWPTATPLYRRSVCENIGPWANLRLLEDWDYDCRAGLLRIRLQYCSELLVIIRRHGSGHAGLAWQRDPNAMRDWVAAVERIFQYAKQANVPVDSEEMQHFARSLFLLSRQCGAAALAQTSRHLFELAQQASGSARSRGLDFRLYRLAASIVGWTMMGRLSGWLDKARR
ncbi:MAG: glycosyltransferase [Thiobacillus sp.]|nr:glycosyltransferase [Thiobacillus sp.]